MTTADERYHARLAQLPQEVLLELCSKIVTENAATRRTAEEVLSQHQPLPAWAIQEVLLSPDLLLHIFPFLEVPDVAAARVCRPWRDAWNATNETRRWLRLAAPEPLAPDFHPDATTGMAALPEGKGIFVCGSDKAEPARIVDSDLRTATELPHLPILPSSHASCTASHLGLFVGVGGADGNDTRLCRYELDGFTLAAEYIPTPEEFPAEDPEDDPEIYIHEGYDCLTLANDMLFAVGFRDDSEDEIICFDARSLTVRCTFGRGVFTGGCYGLAVVGDELYATDKGSDCIKVFSFAGVHLRDITGPFIRPKYLVHFGGRLYVSEDKIGENQPERQASPDWREAGKRIFVLTPEGELLQKFMLPNHEAFEAPNIPRISRLHLCGDFLVCVLTIFRTHAVSVPARTEYRYSCLALKGI